MPTLDPDDTSLPHPARPHHIVDRAREYAALESDGLTAAQISRRRRKSQGYVSIVLRLGRALRRVSAEELAVLRCDRVTWKVAQRVVRTTASDEVILRQLRYAIGGFSSLTIDRRQHRKGRRGAGFGALTGSLASSPGTLTWYSDPAGAAGDPQEYVETYRTFLARLHRHVGGEFRAALAARAAGSPEDPRQRVPLAGQSLRELMRRAAEVRGGGGPAEYAPADVAAEAARREFAGLDALFRAVSESVSGTP